MTPVLSRAQVPVAPVGDESQDILIKARALSAAHHRDHAIEVLRNYLEENDDGDARLLLGLMLSWDGKYDEARRQLKSVLLEHPHYADAAIALVNVELWSDHPETAQQLTSRYLESNPEDLDLLMQRVRALRTLKRPKEAMAVIAKVLVISPKDEQALDTRRAIQEENSAWRTELGQTNTWYSGGFSPWSEQTISIKRGTNAGSMVFRFSRAHQFGEASSLAEMDWYPHVWKGAYMYVNGGFSPDGNLYTTYRFGSDLYQNLGHGWEGSGGFRHLIFNSTSVTVYTALLGRYHSNWYFSGRTFLTPGDGGLSRSIQMQARRYFHDGRSYANVRYSFGASPFEIRDVNEVGILNSSSFAVEWDHSIGRWLFSGSAGWARIDQINRAQQMQYTVGFTASRRF